jgi:PEGA domain/Putative MetA-pathway of phenol degradation
MNQSTFSGIRAELPVTARNAVFFVLMIVLAMAESGLGDPLPTGNLHVSSSPGLRVYVDNKFVGLTTADQAGLQLPALPAGEHQIRVEKAGYQSKRFVVVIQAGTDVELNVGKLNVRPRIRRKPPEEPVDMTVGSPPMVIDDTATPGPGKLEANFVFAADLSTDSDTYESPLVDINYGVGEKVQLKYEVPYAFTRNVLIDEAGNKETVRARGVADSRVGVKYRFYDNDETNLSLAVYPQIEFRSPGARSRENGGVANGATTWILPLQLTKDFAHASITANAGVEKSTDDSHAPLSAGFGAGTRLTDKLAILGEVAGKNLDSADEKRILLDVGLRMKISEKQAFVAALGLDLHAGDGQRHHYITVGYQRFIGK